MFEIRNNIIHQEFIYQYTGVLWSLHIINDQLQIYITGSLLQNKIFFSLKSEAGDKINIHWFDKQWKLLNVTQQTPPEENISNILDEVIALGCDLDIFYGQILELVQSQIVYMDMMLKDASDVFGVNFVQQSIKAYEEFGKELINALNKLSKPKLTIVK